MIHGPEFEEFPEITRSSQKCCLLNPENFNLQEEINESIQKQQCEG